MITPKDLAYERLLRSRKISLLTYDIPVCELLFMSSANDKQNNEKTQS